jgi:hypothetical protein
MEEKYAPVSGMTEPEVPKKKRNIRTALLILGVGVAIVVVALFYGLSSLGILGEKKQQSSEIQTSEAQLKQLLEERRELESRIKTLEEERVSLQANMAEMLSEQVKPLREQVSELVSLKEEIARLQSELEAERQYQKEPEEPEEKPEPKEGSSQKTTLFSALDSYNAKLAEAAKVDVPEPKYTKAKGVQTGQMIKGRLLTTLISSTAIQDFYAVIETTESLSIDGRLSLPAGVRFLGKVVPDYESRRIFVKVEKMQYRDVEMPVSGVVLDERGNPGLVSKYVDPLNQAMWGTLIPNMLAAAADAAQDMVTYYDRDYYEERERPEFSTKNVALQGTADALRVQAQILTEIQTRKKPVIIVNKDIPVLVQITGRVPLDILLESGVTGE